MKPDEINKAIEKECGGPFFGLKKRGLWYRPNAKGYAGTEREAWRLRLEEAKEHEYLKGDYDEHVNVVELQPRDYFGDLNAIHEAWRIEPPLPFKDSFSFRHELARQLSLVVERDYDRDPFWKGPFPSRPFPSFRNLLGTGRDYWIANATAPQRAEAFLRTIGKWIE